MRPTPLPASHGRLVPTSPHQPLRPEANATAVGSGASPDSSVVVRRRECVPLAADTQLALVKLPLDLGSLLEVLVGLGDVLRRWRVSRRRYVVGVVVVEPSSDTLLLGEVGELVVVEMLGSAAVLAAVSPELCRRLVRVM